MKKQASIVLGAVLLSASMASAVVIDNFDNVGDSHSGWRSLTWTEPDTLTNNSGDTRGGQSFGYLDTVNVEGSWIDADAPNIQMKVTLTENIGNELPSLGKIMLADSEDRRWLFYFDNDIGSSLGNPATADTVMTLTSNATSGRDTGQGTDDGSDFDWSAVGKGVGGGQAYWIQLFDVQVGGGAHPINLTFETMDVIPEPATLGLVAVFGGAVVFIRRRLMM